MTVFGDFKLEINFIQFFEANLEKIRDLRHTVASSK